MWESALAGVWLHQSTVLLSIKPLTYQDIQSTLLMGNSFFFFFFFLLQLLFQKKSKSSKDWMQFLFLFFCLLETAAVCVCVYGCVYPPVPCCRQPHCRGKPEPLVLFGFFSLLLQLYKTHCEGTKVLFFLVLFFRQSLVWASQTSVISRSKSWTDHKCVLVSDSFSSWRWARVFLFAAFRAGSGATCCRGTRLKA